ncbi:unnamed protein product, partial [Staurois parvus]
MGPFTNHSTSCACAAGTRLSSLKLSQLGAHTKDASARERRQPVK